MKFRTEKAARKKARHYVLHHGSPRFHMFIVVTMTLVTGFAASTMLLNLGMTRMWLRYGLSAIVAYVAFFGYLYILIFIYWKTFGNKQTPDIDPEDILEMADSATEFEITVNGNNSTSSNFEAGDLFGELDFVAILIAIVMLVAVVFASFYVVYIAPEILFEIVFDLMVSYGFYKVARAEYQKHWTESAVSATIWPFLITLAIVVVAGAILQALEPNAIKLRDIFRN